MAGSQKEFELLFKLKAALGPNFNGAFKSAINTNNQLRDSMKNVNSLQSKIDGYTKQSAAIDKKNKIGYIQLVVTNICSVSMLGMTNKKEKGFEYGNDTDYFFHHYRECLQAG